MKKYRNIVIGIVVILICATIFSILKFEVYNPFSSCFGMLQILFTDKEFVVVQKLPKEVVITKPGYLDEYLKNENLEEIEENRAGSLGTYVQDGENASIYSRSNGYYSILVIEH